MPALLALRSSQPSDAARLFAALALAAGCTAAAATDSITLHHQGTTRSYLAHRPPQHASGTPLPLLIALHGTTMRSADMLAYTDLPALADRAGFVLVAPSSLGNAFNDGLTSAGSEAAAVDDVGFIEAVAEDARVRFGVRAEAIHLVGFSNGGSMVQRVAIESPYPFAGFAAVASAVRVQTAGVLRPAPMLLVFGNADPLNPPGGGWVWIPVPHAKPAHAQTVGQWAERVVLATGPEAELYRRIAPHLSERAIFATNTSGLSINRLAQSLPAELRHRFCGVVEFRACRRHGGGVPRRVLDDARALPDCRLEL